MSTNYANYPTVLYFEAYITIEPLEPGPDTPQFDIPQQENPL